MLEIGTFSFLKFPSQELKGYACLLIEKERCVRIGIFTRLVPSFNLVFVLGGGSCVYAYILCSVLCVREFTQCRSRVRL